MKSYAPIRKGWKRASWILVGIIGALTLAYTSPLFVIAEEPARTAAPEEKAPAAAPKDIPNADCIACHNPDLLTQSKEDLASQVEVDEKAAPARPKPRFITGELNLAIKEDLYKAGSHGETECVACHKGIPEIPHKQRLAAADCKDCHEDSVTSINASVHGAATKRPVGCVGCHDVHYGKGAKPATPAEQQKQCVQCHNANGMDTVAGHAKLYEHKLHLKLDCMLCHSGAKAGVHNITKKIAQCESCHTKATTLSKDKAPGKSEGFAQMTFINPDVAKKYEYVIGANRIPALDTILVLMVLATFGLPFAHGGLRFLTRRKEALHLPDEKILLHPLGERIWHWVQALAIVMLIITGIMIHWPELFPGWFEWGVKVHNFFGWVAVGGFIFWVVYNIVKRNPDGSLRISHYIPKKWEVPQGMITQAKFYGYGIFKHEPHPYAPSENNKFNPLQKIAYFKFQALLMPILLISGVMYMYPETFRCFVSMDVLATVHLILGGLFAAFLVAHLYLATTGETIGENFKAIITGYGIKADHDDHGHGHKDSH